MCVSTIPLNKPFQSSFPPCEPQSVAEIGSDKQEQGNFVNSSDQQAVSVICLGYSLPFCDQQAVAKEVLGWCLDGVMCSDGYSAGLLLCAAAAQSKS